MKKVLITAFSGALLVGLMAAQESAPALPQSAEAPASQPQTQPQSPESQTSAPQSTPQPSTPQSPQVQSPQTGANSAQAAATAAHRVAPGSVIPVLLTKTIDAKKAKTGDEVVAKVTQDLKASSGEVIVAKDTKVVGHVTEAQAHTKEQKESQVGIAFDRAVEKNGNEMQLPMSIQAIIGPQNNGPQNNAGGQGNEAAAPSADSPGSSGRSNTGRSAGMSGSAPTAPQSPSASGSTPPTDARPSAATPITAQTQGVLGISNLKLESSGQNANRGSVVSSEKNNVKLESGTMMLLRVNQ